MGMNSPGKGNEDVNLIGIPKIGMEELGVEHRKEEFPWLEEQIMWQTLCICET